MYVVYIIVEQDQWPYVFEVGDRPMSKSQVKEILKGSGASGCKD